MKRDDDTFGAFRGKSGQISMRRVIAFFYALAGIAAGFYCLYKDMTDWKVLAIAFGLPSLVSIILLLFTTWADLSGTIDSVRGNKQININKTEEEK